MDKILVAKLGRSVGLKGEIRIFLETDFPNQFKPGSIFFTKKNKILEIEYIDFNRNIVKFKNINSVDEAKKLTNSLLYSDIENTKKTCKLEKNQYFWFDIIGCKIIENNEELGIVKDIYRYPLSDYLLIDSSKSFLIPYIDRYIQSVDIENKIIYTKDAKDILLNS